MSQDTTVSNLIINKLTKEQYEGITSPSSNELYFITDDLGIETSDLIGSTAIGSSSIPVYWDGSSFTAISTLSITATAADKLSSSGGTTVFWRGDNTWSNTFTGALNVRGSLNITGTEYNTANIVFNRDGINYITASSTLSTIAIAIGGAGGSNIRAMISDTAVSAYQNNLVSLGTSNTAWSILYSKAGNFSSTTDSGYSTDSAAAVNVTGGLSVQKTASVKQLRIDNAQSANGVTLQYDETNQVLNFVFI